MKHFDIGQWVDMVRGLVTGKDKAEMSAHLSTGCRSCRRTVELLGEVARLGAWEAAHTVPAFALHTARAIFALQQPEKVYFYPRVVARLVYDSFKEPLPAGLRARHRLTRHVLYQAGDYSMDIKMEHQRGTAGVTLVGQIVNRVHPGKLPAVLPVFLASEKKILAQTSSNMFGEFQLTYEPKRRLRLYLQGNEDLQKNIELPLSRLSRHESPRSAPQRNKKRKTF